MSGKTGTAVAAAGNRGRRGWLALVASCAIGAALAASPAGALASANNGPSQSTSVSIGGPFAGNWPGTVLAYGNDFNHWWRLPTTVRAGDSIQLAVDNRLSTRTLHFCLVPPVDNFGAEQALDRCSSSNPYVLGGRQDRVQMTYADNSGQAHLVTYIEVCCMDVGDEAGPTNGQYTVTVERIVSRVTPGLVAPGSIPASFTISAPMVYGDNVAVADGVGGQLQWRYRAERGRKPSPFANLAGGSSVGGAVTFAATLPATARGRRVQLRACANQPGGDTLVCSAAQNTTVQAGSAPACVAAKARRAKRSRSVARLTLKVLGAETRRSRRAAKRKLATAKRRLAAAKRGVRSSC